MFILFIPVLSISRIYPIIPYKERRAKGCMILSEKAEIIQMGLQPIKITSNPTLW